MELLTQDLPSGFHYSFPSITINPMFFGQILEYMENAPKGPVEKFYFDYKVVQGDDPRVDSLLLNDLDYVVFAKKALTIDENIKFKTKVICPVCGESVEVNFQMTDLHFSRMDKKLFEGITLEFGGEMENIKMPTITEFMTIFTNYRRYKKVKDMRLIKLIALFEKAQMYQQLIEDRVIHAVHQDITTLALLDQLFYSTIDPITVYCPKCNSPEGVYGAPYTRGMEIGIQSLISDLFRDVLENNRLGQTKIITK